MSVSVLARPLPLRSCLFQYRRLMLLHPQVSFPAHCFYAVHSAHRSLRLPLELALEVLCRLLKRSRSCHFLEFLQRFGVSIAPQPPQPPVSSSLLEAAVQTTTPCDVPQDASTQTSDQPDTSLCDVAVQTSFDGASTSLLDAAAQTTSPSTLSQHVSTQMGSRSASSFSVDVSVQMSAHRVVQLNAATQLDITEFLAGWIYSDRPLDRRFPFRSPSSTLGAHAAPLPPPGLETTPPATVTQPQLHTNVSSPHSPSLQPTASTTHVGTHSVRPVGAKRSASTAHAGNHNSHGPCPRTEVAPFPKPNAVFLPMLNFGHSKTCGPSHVATADSDIMHHQFRLSILQWNPRLAEILTTLSLLHVVNSMQLSSRKPVTMFRTFLPIFLRTLTTRTSPFCSTRTPSSQTLSLPRLRSNLRAKILGAWCCSLSVLCSVVLRFLGHPQSHFVLYTSTMLWPRNAVLPLIFSKSFTPKCWSTTSTSSVVTST